ncbi:uncharacterized protein SAMN04488134_11622 [Amphibacillus marinus]|uniref:Radical SAM core domain-containing protein n=1 Tax=Amphibacillus marinus TaxID=872970 RepID=A0A1H8TGS7_9BACI|nr:anaerobic sulfatase maturase [Amphibacillus marinus]SEO89708.1 uncharacterized protein SAMN04488134_11622 [Amphibacillus marinus]
MTVHSLNEHIHVSSVMWKTVSEACNLACDYCYYSTCAGRAGKAKQIDKRTLAKFIKEYMEMSHGLVNFVWQGGEPLLAGIDFFETVIYYQKKYSTKYKRAKNSVQTNGILINQRWADFFAEHNFFVGVSLDGPKEINDQRRVTRSGQPSFNLVIRGLNYLRSAGVEFNILTVIHETNVRHGKALMAFYLEEGFSHVQFIPCMDFKAQHLEQPGVFAITAKEYGEFLCEVFDYWYNDGYPTLSIRFFDNLLTAYLNYTPEHCVQQEACPRTIVFEQNGNAYPCDFYMDEHYLLGNITENSFREIASHANMEKFLLEKPSLPAQCQNCEFLTLCHGGCPRNRLSSDNEAGVEYFCESYQQIYRYAEQRMQALANRIKHDKLLALIHAGYPLPLKAGPCTCGSGKAFTSCCESLLSS